jgi:hypothetical protein
MDFSKPGYHKKRKKKFSASFLKISFEKFFSSNSFSLQAIAGAISWLSPKP